ncbi:MAG: NAD(+)/NADH kinase [Candidatus Omnitrophota bacterium]|nr:NAD(+)/NADH kinase [Candidatus Omnitrophota bacterium]
MAASRAKILVVYKKDAYQQYIQGQRDPRLRRLLRQRHPDVVDMQRAHATHQATLEAVVRVLRRLPVEFELAYRVGLKVTKRYQLVVSVGGDGTFLQAARSVRQTPILGVNSDPVRSEAVFCAATRQTFARLCAQALEGRLPELRLARLEVTLNGRMLSPRALNDVLVVHDDPATMSRYRLRIGRREEIQKSSGLWVATAAGSSSAVWAAGGIKLPWSATTFQYRPRELYHGRLSRCRLTGGLLGPQACVRVTWLMRRGSAFLDGPHVTVPLRFADELGIRRSSADSLRVLGLRAR